MADPDKPGQGGSEAGSSENAEPDNQAQLADELLGIAEAARTSDEVSPTSGEGLSYIGPALNRSQREGLQAAQQELRRLAAQQDPAGPEAAGPSAELPRAERPVVGSDLTELSTTGLWELLSAVSDFEYNSGCTPEEAAAADEDRLRLIQERNRRHQVEEEKRKRIMADRPGAEPVGPSVMELFRLAQSSMDATNAALQGVVPDPPRRRWWQFGRRSGQPAAGSSEATSSLEQVRPPEGVVTPEQPVVPVQTDERPAEATHHSETDPRDGELERWRRQLGELRRFITLIQDRATADAPDGWRDIDPRLNSVEAGVRPALMQFLRALSEVQRLEGMIAAAEATRRVGGSAAAERLRARPVRQEPSPSTESPNLPRAVGRAQAAQDWANEPTQPLPVVSSSTVGPRLDARLDRPVQVVPDRFSSLPDAAPGPVEPARPLGPAEAAMRRLNEMKTSHKVQADQVRSANTPHAHRHSEVPTASAAEPFLDDPDGVTVPLQRPEHGPDPHHVEPVYPVTAPETGHGEAQGAQDDAHHGGGEHGGDHGGHHTHPLYRHGDNGPMAADLQLPLISEHGPVTFKQRMDWLLKHLPIGWAYRKYQVQRGFDVTTAHRRIEHRRPPLEEEITVHGNTFYPRRIFAAGQREAGIDLPLPEDDGGHGSGHDGPDLDELTEPVEIPVPAPQPPRRPLERRPEAPVRSGDASSVEAHRLAEAKQTGDYTAAMASIMARRGAADRLAGLVALRQAAIESRRQNPDMPVRMQVGRGRTWMDVERFLRGAIPAAQDDVRREERG